MTSQRPTFGTVIILATAVATFATAALSLYASWRNGKEIQEIHISINSRMDELLALTKKAAHAEGVIEGEGTKP